MKIDKYISKTIYILYNFITNLYNFFFSTFEDIFFKKDFAEDHKLNLEGYCKISDLNIPIIDVSKLEVNVVNKYYNCFLHREQQYHHLPGHHLLLFHKISLLLFLYCQKIYLPVFQSAKSLC